MSRKAFIFGLFIILASFNFSYALDVQVQTTTTFSCSTNAECKKKCEALGSDHTWKPNPGGSTLGSCTKRGKPLVSGDNSDIARPNPPSKADLDSLSVIAKNSQEIHKELNVLFSKSSIAKKLKLEGVQISTFSITVNRLRDSEKDICASCQGPPPYDLVSTLCCYNCNDPCRDPDYVPTLLYSR